MCEYCSVDGIGDSNAESLIDIEHNKFYLISDLLASQRIIATSVDYGCEPIIHTEFKINYCPMCGRKLRED